MQWIMHHPQMTMEALGNIPYFISPADTRSMVAQIHERYLHIGGGWHDFPDFAMSDEGVLAYQDDPPYQPLASLTLGDETLFFYQHSWVAIRNNLSHTHRTARID